MKGREWPEKRGDCERLAEELEPWLHTGSYTVGKVFRARGYNYNAMSSQILICYTSSAALPGLPACPNLPGLLQQLAVCDSKVSTGFFDFIWTPLNRLTLQTGANLVGTTGRNSI